MQFFRRTPASNEIQDSLMYVFSAKFLSVIV